MSRGRGKSWRIASDRQKLDGKWNEMMREGGKELERREREKRPGKGKEEELGVHLMENSIKWINNEVGAWAEIGWEHV